MQHSSCRRPGLILPDFDPTPRGSGPPPFSQLSMPDSQQGPTTEERIATIEARLAAATPGPWFAASTEYGGDPLDGEVWVEGPEHFGYGGNDMNHVIGPRPYHGVSTHENAALIANAPSDLAWLIAELREARAALEEARADVGRLDALLAMPVLVVTVPDLDGSIGADRRLETRADIDAALAHASQYRDMPAWSIPPDAPPSDATRLNWLEESGGYVSRYNEESGWECGLLAANGEYFGHTAREAIDAARASTTKGAVETPPAPAPRAGDESTQ